MTRTAPPVQQRSRRPASESAPADGTEAACADYGLFGPGSATWQLMGEPILWVAGIRALYLQALHPMVMLGTWQNSALVHRREAWARFLRTTDFVRIRTYGTMPEVERAGRRVRKIHAFLTGTDQHVPASVAELDAYYQQAVQQARACDEAKRSLLMSFNPPLPAALLPLKLLVPAINTVAFAALPRWARKLYGAPGFPVTDAITTGILRTLYQATRLAPARLRYTPTVRRARQTISICQPERGAHASRQLGR